MPQDLKSQVANPPGPSPQRGWTGVGIEATSRLTQEQRTLVLKDIKVWLSSNLAGYPPDRLIAGALRSGLGGGPPISQPLAERESAAWVLFLHGVVLYSL
jgi:hypothetical protein